jgi:hypothetical protein
MSSAQQLSLFSVDLHINLSGTVQLCPQRANGGVLGAQISLQAASFFF